MRIGAHHLFSPGLVPSVMVVLGLPVLIALGFWQLDRAEQKGELVAAFQGMADAPPIAVDVGRMNERPAQYRAVVAAGEYLAERSLLQDNKTHKGRAGYHVLTPLRIEASEAAVLVNRGWVPAGRTRDTLPVFETPRGRIEVRGMVYAPSDRQIVLGPEEAHGGALAPCHTARSILRAWKINWESSCFLIRFVYRRRRPAGSCGIGGLTMAPVRKNTGLTPFNGSVSR